MMGEQRQIKAIPTIVSIPEDLREFLKEVHCLTEGLEKGIYKLSEPEGCLCSGDITWSRQSGISGRGIVGFPNEDRSEFDFNYHTGNSVWEFELRRKTLAEIEAGTVTSLALYGCENPLCRYMSSSTYERCPSCNLQLGAGITASDPQKVLGICPYCNGLLRSLHAQQCRHCLMDWHNPETPIRLSSVKQEQST